MRLPRCAGRREVPAGRGEAVSDVGRRLRGCRIDAGRWALRRRGAVLSIEFGAARGVRAHFAYSAKNDR